MSIRFDGKVAIVTGSGNGLGRSHAMELARLGAKVVVNDFGGARDGSGGSKSPAEEVVAEIIAAGGEAMANGANVTNVDDIGQMVADTMARWGRIDILINNAGILRDRSFGNMSSEEWNSVIDVHLNGSANCSLAVWKIMKQQNYGRILMTTSTSGIYGNFGQANYGAAKMAVIGMMNTLCIEGAKNNIQVNCLAPTAATRMTEDVINEEALQSIQPEKVTPAAIYLVSEDGPNRTVMMAGAGSFAVLEFRESGGLRLPEDQCNGDGVAENFARISEMTNTSVFTDGSQ
ncbi:MAG: SDR family NAD(P)-dependent oxidoreductase, partial [Hyphomicrobiales bacterium]|nr:SDR family NAD(P)-dependent oxidoreductase [Hyphomicrobiales bacterium]